MTYAASPSSVRGRAAARSVNALDIITDKCIGIHVKCQRVFENIVARTGFFDPELSAVDSVDYYSEKNTANYRNTGVEQTDIHLSAEYLGLMICFSLIVELLHAVNERVCRLRIVLVLQIVPDVIKYHVYAVIAEIVYADTACGYVVILRITVYKKEYAVGIYAAQFLIFVVRVLHNVRVGFRVSDIVLGNDNYVESGFLGDLHRFFVYLLLVSFGYGSDIV